MRPAIYRGTVTEDSAATLLDRIEDETGNAYAVGSIQSITVRSIDLSTMLNVKTTTLDPSTCITAVATSGGWTEDTIGHNATLPLSGSHWPEGGRTYQVEVTYTPIVGDAFTSLWELLCIETLGS